MNEIKFIAKIAYATKEEDYFMVGFSDDKYDYEHYIILQKAFEFDAQDISLGMDGEYIEIDGQENSGYKCCKKAYITNEHFIMEIYLGEINKVEVLFNQVKIDEKLLQYLQEILGDKLEINIKN